MESYNLYTLTVSTENTFKKSELFYLKALRYTLTCFDKINDTKDHYLQLYLSQSTFLIGSRSQSEEINPFAFVNQKGEIQFDVDISVFKEEIKKFQNDYLKVYIEKGYKDEEAYSKAANDYKNDKLDFYVDANIDLSPIINKARISYEER